MVTRIETRSLRFWLLERFEKIGGVLLHRFIADKERLVNQSGKTRHRI